MFAIDRLTPTVRNLLLAMTAVSGAVAFGLLGAILPSGEPSLVTKIGLSLLLFPWCCGGLINWLLYCLSLGSIGTALEHYFGTKKFQKLFFASIVSALAVQTLCFLASAAPFNLSPMVKLLLSSTFLVGPNIPLLCLLVALALREPDGQMTFNFIIPIKTKYLAILLVVLQLTLQPHQILASLAALSVTYLMVTKDYWFDRATLETPRSSRPRSRLETLAVGKQSVTPLRPRTIPDKDTNQVELEVDRILDKVSRDGMSALTNEEKSTLDRHSSTLRQRDSSS